MGQQHIWQHFCPLSPLECKYSWLSTRQCLKRGALEVGVVAKTGIFKMLYTNKKKKAVGLKNNVYLTWKSWTRQQYDNHGFKIHINKHRNHSCCGWSFWGIQTSKQTNQRHRRIQESIRSINTSWSRLMFKGTSPKMDGSIYNIYSECPQIIYR